MKFLLLFISISIYSFAFSQFKSSEEKTITTGEEINLKFVNASITPPSGYFFMEDYSSFLNQQNQTSISVVRDDKIPYQAFVESMLKKDYTIGNAKLLSSEQVEKGYFFTFLFTINNAPVERIVYVTGDDNFCIWVTANYKQVDKEKHLKTLKDCLLSIQYKS